MNAVAKAQAEAYELVERYLHRVEQNLPKNLRQDVMEELRPLLDESLQDRALEAGRAPDEEIAVEVLRRFGKPEEVALRYTPEQQYLIGPRMYPAFLHVTRIVLIVVAAFYLFWFTVSVAGMGKWSDIAADRVIGGEVTSFVNEFVTRFTNMMVQFTQTALANIAILVIAFAIADRVSQQNAAKEESWDPRKLPALPKAEEKKDKDVISVGDRMFKIYATLALAAILNFYPHWFGITFINNNDIRNIPYWALGLNLPVLLMNVWWGGALALNVWLLKMGRWTREARWCEFGLGLFGLGIVWLIIASSGPAQFDTASWSDAPSRLVEVARRGVPWAGRAVVYILKWVLAIGVIEALWRLYRLFTRYPLWRESEQV